MITTHRLCRVAAALVVSAALALPASAQTLARQRALEEIAGHLGAAHYLKVLCDGRGAQQYRDAMRSILEREAPTDGSPPREAMVERFNNGYLYMQNRHSGCDARARDDLTKAAGNGRDAAQKLAELDRMSRREG
jgi:uncharacterized protein (TIGR02301 family)